jgi:hypothetical protein
LPKRQQERKFGLKEDGITLRNVVILLKDLDHGTLKLTQKPSKSLKKTARKG